MIRARDILREELVWVLDSSSLGGVLSYFQKGEDILIVEDINGEIKGFFRPINLYQRMPYYEDQPVKDFITPFKTISPMMKMGDLLYSYNAPLLVVEEEKVLGVITEEEILEGLKGEFSSVQELNREMEAIINSVYDEIYVTDPSGETLWVNKAFERNSGVKVEDVIGRNVMDLEREGIFYPSVTRFVLEDGEQKTILQRLKNGNEVLVTGNPVFNKDGSIFRVICNSRDVTELVRLKTRLKKTEELKDRYYQELRKIKRKEEAIGDIIASSNQMKKILQLADKIASVESTVLLLGETGVGKSLLARRICRLSDRFDKPFVEISCGAIPENLLEAELFGYEAGAFTGARKGGKKGKIEVAQGGTLFLDEVGEISLKLQVKLLQIIDDQVLVRVGGTKGRVIDVRILSATNKNLREMVREGTFREDLFFRLNVVPIEIPPLRERRDDILPLVNLFLKKFNKKYGQKKEITPEVFKILSSYTWPGNIRELENHIERMVVTVFEDRITPEHLSSDILENSRRETFVEQKIVPLREAREEMEIDLLTRAYQRYTTTTKMAQVLQIDQSTVVRKMQKYRIRERTLKQ